MRCCRHSRVSLIRRLIAAYVAACIGYFSVVSPVRAFAPVAVLAAPQLVSASGASYALGALAGLIGLAGLYLNIPDADGNSARIPVANNPAAMPPPPVAEPTAPGEPTLQCQSSAIGGVYPSISAICSALASAQNSQLCGGIGSSMSASCVGVSESGFQVSSTCTLENGNVIGPNVGSYSAGCASGPDACPPGYSWIGNQCALTNPREAKPDKNCDVGLSGGSYTGMGDVDCPSGPLVDHGKPVPVIRDGGERILVPGQDSQGRPMIIEIQRSPDGSHRTITSSVQEGTNVRQTSITVDSEDGTIVDATNRVNPGQITIPTSSPTDPNTVSSPTTTPRVSTDTSRAPEINFPDDYSREPTLQATKTAVQQIHEDLTKTESTDDPTVSGSSEFNDAFFNGTFNALKGWNLPGHTSTCPVGSFNWNSVSYSIDAHCQLVTTHFDALRAAMTVVWTLVALFVVLRA